MPLPTSIASIRIHPSIGFARLSTNPDFYVFGDAVAQYKSNNLIKRQAVRFRLFAYGSGGEGIEELTPAKLTQYGVRVVWQADVANRKIASQRSNDAYTISARGSAGQNAAQLVGRCGDFVEGQSIPLGEIRPDGLFVPPIAGVFRASAATAIPDTGMYSEDVADNTCDGPIAALLYDGVNGGALNVRITPAWVFVTPSDFAPDWDDITERNLFPYLRSVLGIMPVPPLNAINAAARQLDRESIECGTSTFSPGIEMYRPVPSMFFNPASVGDPEEMRLQPRLSGIGSGTSPGELTATLCSPWQFDFRACTCNYWPAQRPDLAFKDSEAGPEVNWRRKNHNDASPAAPKLETNPQFVDHVHELGIVRKQNNKRVETERPNDIT